MTDRITAIKKALEGVTSGPWELCAHLKHNDACECGYRGVIFGPEPDGYAICQPGHEPAPEGQEGTEPPRYPRDVEIANMRYIATINPEAISDLLSTLESLQRENERLRSGLEPFALMAGNYDGIPPSKYHGDIDFQLHCRDQFEAVSLGRLLECRYRSFAAFQDVAHSAYPCLAAGAVGSAIQ